MNYIPYLPLNPIYSCPFYQNAMLYQRQFYTNGQVEIMNQFRMLWEQHGFWTRSAIISMVLGLPDEKLVIERLLRNPVDFEQTLKLYYGDRIAGNFRDLLKSHLTIAAEIVKASKAGNKEAAEKAEREWYSNADEIAALLGSINPYWSAEVWRNMLYQHLALVKAEAVHMLTKDYADGISVFEDIERQALSMADMMSAGIIQQFPYKFR